MRVHTDLGYYDDEQGNVYYEDFVKILLKEQLPELMKAHCGLGVTGEAGEMADVIKRDIIYGHANLPDGQTIREGIVEEAGDLLFYLQATLIQYDIGLHEVVRHNIDKLQKRYTKMKYSDKAAQDRADKQTGEQA